MANFKHTSYYVFAQVDGIILEVKASGLTFEKAGEIAQALLKGSISGSWVRSSTEDSTYPEPKLSEESDI